MTEFFLYKDSAIKNHCAIRTSAYERGKSKPTVEIFGLDCITAKMNDDDKILIVDNVIDSGRTMKKVLQELNAGNADVRTATIYYSSGALVKPDYYVHETNDYIFFAHELECLSKYEIVQFQGADIAKIVD